MRRRELQRVLARRNLVILKPTDRVVLFNTGSGLKYTDVTAEAMHLQRPAVST
jgi:threonine synthase